MTNQNPRRTAAQAGRRNRLQYYLHILSTDYSNGQTDSHRDNNTDQELCNLVYRPILKNRDEGMQLSKRGAFDIISDGDVCMTIECYRISKPIGSCFRGGMIGGAIIYFLRRKVDHLKKNDGQFHPFYFRARNDAFNKE